MVWGCLNEDITVCAVLRCGVVKQMNVSGEKINPRRKRWSFDNFLGEGRERGVSLFGVGSECSSS